MATKRPAVPMSEIDEAEEEALLKSDEDDEDGGSGEDYNEENEAAIENRRLKKAILPRNAIMALNDVQRVRNSDFEINNIANGGGFKAVLTFNNQKYEGKGHSKAIAKNEACEKVLRSFVSAKMRKKPRISSQTGSGPMDTAESNDLGNESDGGSIVSNDYTDVPMNNLASFALYKLFSKWEKEGYTIPRFHPAIAHNSNRENNQPEKVPKKPPVRLELPPNWKEMHPATLLCIMRPGLAYSDWHVKGEIPNLTQTLSVVIDGKEFRGTGKSKKIARKIVAINACNKLFGTNFSEYN